MLTALFIACDDKIGRVDLSTLLQQTLMGLFLFGLNKPWKICGTRVDPDELCDWRWLKKSNIYLNVSVRLSLSIYLLRTFVKLSDMPGVTAHLQTALRHINGLTFTAFTPEVNAQLQLSIAARTNSWAAFK